MTIRKPLDLLDEAGVDVLLVGDSLGMGGTWIRKHFAGHSRRDVASHARCTWRGTRHALLVADMPYGSYHDDPMEAVRHAIRFVKEAGAEAVKLEGGERRMDLIARLVEAEIPVMGHIDRPDAAIVQRARRIPRAGQDGGSRRTIAARRARGGSRGSFFYRNSGIDSCERSRRKLPPSCVSPRSVSVRGLTAMDRSW